MFLRVISINVQCKANHPPNHHRHHYNTTRGIVLQRSASWEIVSRPFEKFFNQQESECEVSEPKRFNDRCHEFNFVEKADGSCLQLWWCSPDAIEDAFNNMVALAAAVLPEVHTPKTNLFLLLLMGIGLLLLSILSFFFISNKLCAAAKRRSEWDNNIWR